MDKLSSHTIKEISRVFHSAPFISDIGFELISVDVGECISSLNLKNKHLQQDGFVHAGVQATMADHTAGTATATLLGPDEIVLTAEFKINFLRAAKGEILKCFSKVLKAGSQITVVESEVFCEGLGESKLVSKAILSMAIVKKKL